MKQLFNDGWLFAKTKADKTLENDWGGDYSPVQLPHDWLIYHPDNLYETSFGRYVKKYDFGDIKNKSVRLYFEGVYMDSTVYVNKKPAFDWKYGYSSFEAVLTDFLTDGENEISVLVRHYSPNTRWYSGAGIFRDVYLIVTEKSYLATDGIYFHTDKTENGFDVKISAEVVNPDRLTVEFSLKSGDDILHKEKIPAADISKIDFSVNSPDKKYIWDIASPNLLDLTVSLIKDGEIIDSCSQKVGLREIEYKPDSGFYLNGRHIKLNGVCLHHDLGCLGAAFNKAAAKRQLETMLEMGVNSVRTSHNPPAKAFMELCDEMGILVNSEAFDMWERPKTEFDYARFFDDWYKKDVASWVRRDRNHPSVIMWSVGNEIYDTHVSPRGAEVAKMLHDAVRENDTLCNAPTTIGSNYMPWEGAQNCAKQVDLAGYNYLERLYEEHHKQYPDWKIYGSETTSGVKSRGIYHFPIDAVCLTHSDLQCSSLGNCRAGASADTAQKIIAYNRDIDVCAGMYIWTGADYIGEPSPYSTKNAYFGNIDTAGLKKDSFYLYEAAWTDKPVLHIMPYWDYNEGQLIDIVCYTNLEEVELFLNGRSLGKKTPHEYTAIWRAAYEKGELKAVGIKDGKTHEAARHSFTDSKAIRLEASKSEILADGEDITVITISTVDKDGYPVENARDRIALEVTGGRLLGFDNGDSTDYDSYKSVTRRLFSGLAAAYIASDTKAGEITVKASANGLDSAEITLKKLPASPRNGISTSENITNNPDGCDTNEIPLRKIELKMQDSTTLTPENPECRIIASLLPANTSYTDIKWSVVTNTGIETNVAKVEANGLEAVVSACGDGVFRLRCSSNNGRSQPEIISEYEFTAVGFGSVTVNPYEFTCGCLCNYSLAPVDEVRCGGVSIKPDNNIIGFKKTDFGKFGSDSFLVRIINWHSDDPFNFRLWEGEPFADNSKILGDFTYRADFEWQTFKDNSYTLQNPICGEKDIYFEFDKNDFRIDFGGFLFTPRIKAYQYLTAADCDLIHGDSFRRDGTAVKEIGNNVFLDYCDMDFSKGVKAVRLTGVTRHDNDSVHIHFHTDKGRVEEIIEFAGSDEPVTKEIPLPDVRGTVKVEFRFLPGCDFDFYGFEIIPREE